MSNATNATRGMNANGLSVYPAQMKALHCSVKLDPDAVENAVLTAVTETDAVIRIFRMVYPEFDAIASVNGHPTCNKTTWLLVCGWFNRLTERLNEKRDKFHQVMPGGPWLNWGFSAHGEESTALRDWHVIPAEVTMKEVIHE